MSHDIDTQHSSSCKSPYSLDIWFLFSCPGGAKAQWMCLVAVTAKWHSEGLQLHRATQTLQRPLPAHLQLWHVLCMPVAASETKTVKLTVPYLCNAVANLGYAKKPPTEWPEHPADPLPQRSWHRVHKKDLSPFCSLLRPVWDQLRLSKAARAATPAMGREGVGLSTDLSQKRLAQKDLNLHWTSSQLHSLAKGFTLSRNEA